MFMAPIGNAPMSSGFQSDANLPQLQSLNLVAEVRIELTNLGV